MLQVVKNYIFYFFVLFQTAILFNISILAQNKITVHTKWAESIFKHLTIEDGLSQSYPLAIEQDSKGFMWFATMNGLNKYDGYSFTVYTHNPYDSTTISSNSNKLILEDSRGILWIVPYLNDGINLMDSRTEMFRKIPFTTPDIRAIAEDKEGNIWIGTGSDGLFLIESNDVLTSNFHYTQFKKQPENPNSLSDNSVWSIAVDRDNVLWIGTDSCLNKLSRHENVFKHYSFLKKESKSNIGNMIHSTLINEDNTLWLGSIPGLILFNKIDGSFTCYERENDVNYNISAIAKDRDGNLWISDGGGLTVFNVDDRTYNYLYKNPDYDFPGIVRLIADRVGNIWMGSNAYGAYIYFPESNRFNKFSYQKPNNQPEANISIRSIFEDSQNNLWFSSYNFIYRWNRVTNEIINFGNPLNDKAFGSSGASSITEDKNGNILFATYHDLFAYNLKTNLQTHIILESNPDNAIRGTFVDRSGSIWIVNDKYLSKSKDIQTGTFINYTYNPKGIYPASTSMIYEDENGAIWFTSTMGLIKFDQKSEDFTYYKNDPKNYNSIYSNFTKCICPDPNAPNEKLWIGTSGGGLNLFDKNSETFTHILEEDGLPDNVVYGILPDEEGNLWLSTNRGLTKYNPVTEQFINYDVNDGLQSNEFNSGAFFKSKSGEMFFGGINGFNYFYPKDIANKYFIPQVVFTDFKLFNKSVSVSDSNSILRRVISETKEITLSYNQNIFSFEFALLDYYAPHKNQFAYRLDGFNEDWIRLGNKREITFTSLDPGKYTLKVKGTNSDGIWNENPASLVIIITPPFWKTWWAYGFYLIILVSILYGIRKYEMNRMNWKNQHKLDEVKLKEREESDKMKSRFFANISHEFRTPLTLILGPIQKWRERSQSVNSPALQGGNTEIPNNKQGLQSLTTELQKDLTMAERNARNLLSLVSQLLDLSKLEAGKLELKTSKANIVTFIKGITMSFESVAERKDITLKVNSLGNEIELYFDKEKMIKIMTNLLSNAFKFTPEGGQITVSVSHAELVSASPDGNKIPNQVRNDNVVKIGVKDTGIGISEKELPKLFDRFFQVDSSQTREHEGTGIGLALTKELVELHHGTISVNSKLGEWAEFTVTLPVGRRHLKDEEVVEDDVTTDDVILNPDFVGMKNLMENNAADSSHFDPAIAGQAKLPIGTGSVTDNEVSEDKYIVLVVEDNADVREFIKDSLGNEFQIEEAANGEQGVRKAEQIIPDLIISDIMMPKMDGNELTRRIKNDERTSHIPIILLTAKSEQESKLEGLETGADDYLTKPFDTKELQIRINNLINIRRKLKEKYSRIDIVPVRKEIESSTRPGKDKAGKLSNLEEQFMCKVMEVIEKHISEEDFSIEDFGKEVGMSRMQLHRKLKALSGKSASNYLRSVRLNKAKKMIEEQKGNISEIAYSVGFSSPQYFTRSFKEEFGYPPSELA